MTLWLLLACTTTSEPSPESAGVPFPHPAEYAHGADAMAFEDTCLGCHREESAIACESCHESYPHRVGWLAGETHGADLEGCADCHGAEGVTPACTSCHSTYPHDEGWGEAGAHGAASLAAGSPVVACGTCHGEDLGGRGETPACSSCHDHPHSPGYPEHPEADLSTCTGCHGEGGSGGRSGVACVSCHPGYPHAEEWTSGHIAAARLRGEQTCMACHEDGDGPATMPATCGGSCHGGAP